MSGVVALAVFGAAFVLIATERFHRVKIVLIAAAIMVLLGFVSEEHIFFSHHSGIDWNVVFLLLGMMIIVGVLKGTGLFEFLGIWAAKRSRGRPYRLMVLFMVLTAVASPFVDNVTTVMLVAPVTLAVCEKLDIPAAPYLIAEVLASNIGGSATLIGDPPNIIIGSRAGLGFNDFIVHMAPIAALLFVMFTLMARVMFRKQFRYNPARVGEVMQLDERKEIVDGRLLARCLVVMALVIVAFSIHSILPIEPPMVALLGAGLMVLVSGSETSEFLAAVEWETLVFFMGLFVMVGALVETGVIHRVGSWAAQTFEGNMLGAATVLLFGSALFGAFLDNIPFTATLAPVVEDMAAAGGNGQDSQALWWAFALGACLGGNGTAIAASANVVVLGIAARHGQPISFWQFTRYGVVTTAATCAVAWLYVWLRYFA